MLGARGAGEEVFEVEVFEVEFPGTREERDVLSVEEEFVGSLQYNQVNNVET